MRIFLLISVFVFVVSCSGAKEQTIKCGDGTVLKDGVCVVAKTEASPKTCSAEEELKDGVCVKKAPAPPKEPVKVMTCEDTCKKVAECKGLNASAPLILTRCKNLCEEYQKSDAKLLKDLLECQQKETCQNIDSCLKAYETQMVKQVREPAETDMVVITKAKVSPGEYVGKELSISYKSNADKDIDGIKLQYFCFNNFDESVANGRLIDQDVLKPKKSSSGTWKIYEDSCTKVKVVVTNVHFVDGTEWTP